MPKPRRDAASKGPERRKHLSADEVENLIKAARSVGRNGHRDATMILIAFRHGMRASELCGLKVNQVDRVRKVLHVRRLKGGSPSTHPLTRRELVALEKVIDGRTTGHVFLTDRDGPLSASGFHKIVSRAGRVAGFDLRVHPHMFRHACGYELANQGVPTRSIQAYLGHRNIQHTVKYTELASGAFDGFFED